MAVNERRDIDGAERDPGLERLYAESSLDVPPVELDQAIRAAARREVRARPQALGARLRKWRLPISIAAVVVLSVSIVTLMREEGSDRLEEGLSPPAEPGVPAAPAVGDSKLKAGESAESPDRGQAPAPRAAPAPAAGLVMPSAKEAQEPGRHDAPAARRAKPAQPFTKEKRQPTEDTAQGSASRQPEAAKTPLPGAARVLRAPASSIQGGTSETEEDSAGKPSFMKSERSLRDSTVSALLRELEDASPEAWLQKIDALRREGKNAEADELKQEFQRRFPRYTAPNPGSGAR